MKKQTFDISGLQLLIPRIFEDNRGYFLETFRASFYYDMLGTHFVQDNMSFSKYGTIRGLHYQRDPYGQAKLVRCAFGVILDVAVDIRPDSATFGKYVSVVLSAENQNQLFIPVGFAHGFSTLSAEAIVEYKCNNYYNPKSDAGISFRDPDLSIDWKIMAEAQIVSDKDAKLPYFKDIRKRENK